MSRTPAVAALGFAIASCSIWIANALEITVLRPHRCSLQRMQFESWLFLGRAAAVILPVLGLLLALAATRSPGALRSLAFILNAAVVLYVVATFAHLIPMGHLPCLRD